MNLKCLFGHKWNGCKCERCGRIGNHDWDGCICKRCGQEQHDWNSYLIEIPDDSAGEAYASKRIYVCKCLKCDEEK
ncbi:MAG: hypothetical protein FWC39_10750 [Bacteroidetes bacterium]|nr:hypothetical protein [Bacteroidota bacterium]